MRPAEPLPAAPRQALYRLIWRWHFYAGIFCLPFVLWLACTGLIYLFKPQLEPLLERRFAAVTTQAAQAPSRQVAAALGAVPGSVLHSYELPGSAGDAVRILVARDGEVSRVFVDPASLKVLHTVAENDRFMRVVAQLHGELRLGSGGSLLVELAASWTILMLLTGLYLWWPRGTAWRGVVVPRLGSGSRVFWRDLHAVTGLWISLFALFLLLSGLPWAKNWGGMLKSVRQAYAQTQVAQDWTTGSAAQRDAVLAAGRAAAGHDGHAGVSAHAATADLSQLDRIVPLATAARLAVPVLVVPPVQTPAQWTIKSDAANRPLRAEIVVDGRSGDVVRRSAFAERPLLDRFIGYGIAIHEGQLFPPLNQLLGVFTALGLIMLSTSAAVLWWRRRPQGMLGAPPRVNGMRYPAACIVALVVLGTLLPLLGMSMLLVLLLERLALRHWPRARHLLGLALP